jgi:hypothetical protein
MSAQKEHGPPDWQSGADKTDEDVMETFLPFKDFISYSVSAAVGLPLLAVIPGFFYGKF